MSSASRGRRARSKVFDEIMPTDQLKEAAARADYLINILPATKDNLLLFDRATSRR